MIIIGQKFNWNAALRKAKAVRGSRRGMLQYL